MSEHKCAARVRNDWHNYPCSKPGKHEEDGKWWCGLHLPSRVAAKREASTAKWNADLEAKIFERAVAEASAAEQARRAACFDELLALLQGISDNRSACFIPNDRDGLFGFDEKLAAAIANAKGAK